MGKQEAGANRDFLRVRLHFPLVRQVFRGLERTCGLSKDGWVMRLQAGWEGGKSWNTFTDRKQSSPVYTRPTSPGPRPNPSSGSWSCISQGLIRLSQAFSGFPTEAFQGTGRRAFNGQSGAVPVYISWRRKGQKPKRASWKRWWKWTRSISKSCSGPMTGH